MKSRGKPELSQNEVDTSRTSVTDADVYVTPDVTDEPLVWREGIAVLARHIRAGSREPVGWTPDSVRERMESAIRLVHRQAGRVGPAGYGTAMPEYVHDWGDQLQQAMAGTLHEDGNRIRLGATAAQVSAMERALDWAATYLIAHPQPLRFLNLHLESVATRQPFSRLCKAEGAPLATAKRHRSRALSIIALGLTLDGVKP